MNDSKMSLNDDGTITVIDDGTTYTLKVPRFGEYREIKRSLVEAQARIDAQSAIAEEQLQALKEKEDATPADVARCADELTDYVAEQLGSVVSLTFSKLSDVQLPDDPDAWPAWLTANQHTARQMIQHWRTVPLGRG